MEANKDIQVRQSLADRLFQQYQNSPRKVLLKEISDLKLLLADEGGTEISHVQFNEMVLSAILIMEDLLDEIE